MVRTILFAAILMSGMAVKAQVYPQQVSDTNNIHKKWFVTKYAGISSGFIGFGGGSSSFLSIPLALQINRQLTNNLYAFGSVSVTPYVFHNNGMLYQTPINKNNSFMQPNKFAAWSDAKIGLMYINNERTFSISGSIGVSRGYYNRYSPVYAPVYSPVPANTFPSR